MTIGVRPAAPEDAGAIAAIYGAYVTGSYATFDEEPPGPESILSRMMAAPRLPWLVAESEDRVVGYAYAAHHRARPAYRWSVDCSVYLAAEATGHGTGRALYEHLLPTLDDLGYVSAYAAIALPNEPSVRLHEGLGFRHLGTFRDVGFKQGQWRDVGWWHRPLVAPPPSPEEPRAWSPG